jgi:hypothetical protein
MQIEYAVFIPSLFVATVKFATPDPNLAFDDTDTHGHARNSSWLRRWYSRAMASRSRYSMVMEWLMFSFLLFFIGGILASESKPSEADVREMISDSNRNSFVLQDFAVSYILGALVFCVFQDFAVATLLWLFVTTALSTFVSASDGRTFLYRTLVNGTLWAIGVGIILIFLCCCAAKMLGECITNKLHSGMEPLLIGMTMSFCIFVFINSWDYYLLREDNNWNVFWFPMLIGLIISALALVYRWERGNEKGVLLLKKVEDTKLALVKKRKKKEDLPEEEEDEDESSDV